MRSIGDTALYVPENEQDRGDLYSMLELEADFMLDPSGAGEPVNLEVQCESAWVDVDRHVIGPLIQVLGRGRRIVRCTPGAWVAPEKGDLIVLDVDAADNRAAVERIPASIMENRALYDWLRMFRLSDQADPCIVHVHNAGSATVNIQRFFSILKDTRGRAVVISGVRGDSGWSLCRGGHVASGFSVFALSAEHGSSWAKRASDETDQ